MDQAGVAFHFAMPEPDESDCFQSVLVARWPA